MGKREHLGEAGRRQPVHHGRSQFLDREHVHVVLPHNAKNRGRVGRTAQGVQGEQAQPERRRGRSGSARRAWRGLAAGPPEGRQLPVGCLFLVSVVSAKAGGE